MTFIFQKKIKIKINYKNYNSYFILRNKWCIWKEVLFTKELKTTSKCKKPQKNLKYFISVCKQHDNF